MLKKLIFLIVFIFTAFANAELVRVKKVDKGVWRGSQPITESDYQKIKDLGVKTLISLRWEEKEIAKEKEMATNAGMKFISAPMKANEKPSDELMDMIFKNLLASKNRPVYLHCKLGKDRTGLVFALYRVFIQKWEPAEAYEEWKAMGFSYNNLHHLRNYFKEKTGYSSKKNLRDACKFGIKRVAS